MQKTGQVWGSVANVQEGSADLLEEIGDDHQHVAMTYNNMAYVCYNQGKHEEALETYKNALSMLVNKLGDDHPDVASTYENIGLLYEIKLNKYKEALDSTARP